MNKRLFIAISLLIVMFSVNLRAQDLNKLWKSAKKRATKKVEQKVSKSVDKAVNKVVDKAVDKTTDAISKKLTEMKKKNKTSAKNNNKPNSENKPKSENEQVDAKEPVENKEVSEEQEARNYLNKLTGGKNIKYSDVYFFDAVSAYRMESFDNKGKSKGVSTYKILINKNTENYAMSLESGASPSEENKLSTFVYDKINNSFLVLSENDKTGIVMPGSAGMDEEVVGTEQDEHAEKEMDVNTYFKKTGKTKKILGYKCDEYYSKDGETESYAWTTKEFKYKSNSMFNKNSPFSKQYSFANYPTGYLMELNTTNIKTKEKFHLLVTKLDDNTQNKISLKAYKLTKLAYGIGN